MRKKIVQCGILLPMFACAGLCPLQAQDAEEDEEVYELSPFTISEDEAVGYQATTTLAGTRLKTDLRDIGSAISVFTEDVFEDTGAVDAETILSYGLNTEVGGVQGNFAGGLGTNHNGRAEQDIQRTNPQFGITEWKPKLIFDNRLGLTRGNTPNVAEVPGQWQLLLVYPGVNGSPSRPTRSRFLGSPKSSLPGH